MIDIASPPTFQEESDLVIGDKRSHLMTSLLLYVTVGICWSSHSLN